MDWTKFAGCVPQFADTLRDRLLSEGIGAFLPGGPLEGVEATCAVSTDFVDNETGQTIRLVLSVEFPSDEEEQD